MSNFFKIAISFLLTAFAATIIFLLFFLNVFNIKSFDFVNAMEEQRFSSELKDISVKIDNAFINEESTEINPFIKTIDLDKFTGSKNRRYDITRELAGARELILKNTFIRAVKFFDNNRNIIFSTNEDEREINYGFITFLSKDGIEKRNDFYKFSAGRISFLSDPADGSLILKKNLENAGKPVGVMLFYFDASFINDILRIGNFTDIGGAYIADNNAIIVVVPEQIDKKNLTGINIDSSKIRNIVYSDKYGNMTTKKYRIFSTSPKHTEITVARLVDNSIFDFDFRVKTVLFFLAFFVLYLLILMIFIASDRSRLSRIRGRASLFTASIVEEIIRARSRNDLETILKELDLKRENTLHLLIDNPEKIREKDMSFIKEQLNVVFDKISGLLETKLKEFGQGASLDKVEMLLEKFVNTIAEKGIQINAPLNVTQVRNAKQLEDNLKEIEVEEIESLDGIEEAEAAEEISPLESVEEAESIEEIDEALPVEEAEPVEELENIDEAEPLENLDTEELSESNLAGEEPVIAENEMIEDLNEAEPIEPSEADEEIEVEEIPPSEQSDLNEESADTLDLEIDEETGEGKSNTDSIPKIPDDFYNVTGREDELAKQIEEINREKSPLQSIFDEIYQELNATKLSFLINMKNKTSFMQVNQVGNEKLHPELMIMDEANPLVKHIFDKQRMVFVSDIKKFKSVCDNRDYIKSYSDMKSLFIYPVKFFNKIKALVLIFFKDDMTENLETIIEDFEKHQSKLKKEVSRII